MFCVGVTGNLASGKSTVCQLFEKKGIEVLSADLVARELTLPSQAAFQAIIQEFGQELINAEGQLDRAQLRHLVFQDSKKRLWLESLLHPLIRKELEKKAMVSSSPYTLLEIPLLRDKRSYPYLDRILVVLAKQEQLVERALLRNQLSQEQAMAILAAQMGEEKLRQLADDLLVNQDSLEELAKKVENLHQKYLQLASQKS